MHKYNFFLKSIEQYSKVCKNRQKYANVLNSMKKCAQIWLGMQKYAKLRRRRKGNINSLRGLAKYGHHMVAAALKKI